MTGQRTRTRTALAALAAAGLLAAGCGSASGGPDAEKAGNAELRQEERAGGAEAGAGDSAHDGDRAEQDSGQKGRDEPDEAADDPGDKDDGEANEPLRTEQKAAGGGSAAAPWCATDDLSASVRGLNSAAGNRYAALVLTNTSDSECRTRGWTGLQLVTADGTDVPTDVVRDRSRTPAEQTLAPGSAVWSRLHWTVVPSGSDDAAGACRPKPAELEVIPPDTYDHTDTAWKLGEVCDSGRIEALPLAKGDGPAR